jgi:hypothetical protein
MRPDYSHGERRNDLANGAGGRATMRAVVCGVQVDVLCSQADVARALGVTQTTAGKIEREALRKLVRGIMGRR